MSDRMTDDYSSNSLTQQKNQALVLPLFLKNVRAYLAEQKDFLSKKGYIAIADLGCADGKNDIKTLQSIIELVNELVPGISIMIYMNDLQQTNASTIIQNVEADIKDENVFLYAKPASFYQSLFPQKSIDIFFTFTAIHWLPGKAPAPSNGFLNTTQFQFTDEESFKIWMEFQERSLLSYYDNRYKELTQGGILFISAPFPWSSEADKKRTIQSDQKSKKFMGDVLKQYGYGDIIKNINVNVMFRTQEDFLTILQKCDKVKFKVVDAETLSIETPLLTMYKNKEIDEKQFAKLYVNYRKATSYHPFKSSMIENGVEEAKAIEILDKIYQLLEDATAHGIGLNSETISTIAILLQKVE